MCCACIVVVTYINKPISGPQHFVFLQIFCTYDFRFCYKNMVTHFFTHLNFRLLIFYKLTSVLLQKYGYTFFDTF